MNDQANRPAESETTCRREDVIALYNLLLRRQPENEEAVNPRIGRPLADIFKDILCSKEFALRLQNAAAARRFGTTPYRGSMRLSNVLGWAAECLPLSPETRDRLASADDWEAADIALARDPGVADLLPALRDPGIQRVIERRSAALERGVDLDAAFVSPQGWCFLSGGLEAETPTALREIAVYRGGELLGTTEDLMRCRQRAAAVRPPNGSFDLPAFWAVLPLARPAEAGARLEIVLAGGRQLRGFTDPVRLVDEARLRDVALQHLAGARYFGDPTVEAFMQLDNGAGRALVELSAAAAKRIAEGASSLRFGARRPSYDGSIIVCISGRAELLTLQAALFSQCADHDRYEFIYVANSPELASRLAEDAEIASRIYGLAITLVVLPGNTGSGPANNLAAAAAESDRLVFLAPEAVPRDPDWPRHHSELVAGLAAEQVKLFGTALYYGDGALMHAGSYIDLDSGFALRDGGVVRRAALRVEHYDRGAQSPSRRDARPVPAVSGACMSVDRAWFERLGGFSQDYVLGEGADADLCLRSLEAGTPAWFHDLSFWYLQPQGSTETPALLGGRLLSRWLLTSSWGEKADFLGRDPARLAR